MIARKITDAFSLQASANLSWFNKKSTIYDVEGNYLGFDTNGQFSASFLGRYKVTDIMSLIANVDVPLTDQEFTENEANISFGVEMVTSAHAFQIFLGRHKSILPQYNHAFSENTGLLIGFNITRLWNF